MKAKQEFKAQTLIAGFLPAWRTAVADLREMLAYE
jgi:hypothetical protein